MLQTILYGFATTIQITSFSYLIYIVGNQYKWKQNEWNQKPKKIEKNNIIL
jgi:hypothetical protein